MNSEVVRRLKKLGVVLASEKSLERVEEQFNPRSDDADLVALLTQKSVLPYFEIGRVNENSGEYRFAYRKGDYQRELTLKGEGILDVADAITSALYVPREDITLGRGNGTIALLNRKGVFVKGMHPSEDDQGIAQAIVDAGNRYCFVRMNTKYRKRFRESQEYQVNRYGFYQPRKNLVLT